MRRQRWFASFLTLLLLFGLTPSVTWAQAQTTGEVTGTVRDASGTPLAGATVTITGYQTGLEREATTNAKGTFLFGVLPVGNYSLLVASTGLQPQVYSFRLGVGERVPFEVSLSEGTTIEDTIEVLDTATAMATSTAQQNLDFDKTIEELPIQVRELEDVALYVPNTSGNGPHSNSEREPAGGGISIAGAPTYDVVVMLDGAEISDPLFGSSPEVYLEDAIEEVQVLTSGISARYGRFQGGVINAVSKSGGNDFEATFRTEVENESWNGTSPFGEAQADDDRYTHQVTGGGFLVKDRLWFFGGGRLIPDSTEAKTTSATAETVIESDDETRYQLKLRGAPTTDHVISASHMEFERNRLNRAGLTAGDAKAHTGMRLDDRSADALSYQGVLSSNLFIDVQATQKEVAIASGGSSGNGDPIFDLVRGEVFNNHWWDFDDPGQRDNETFSVNLTQAVGTENFGNHNLEYGAQYVKSTLGGENRQSSTGFNMLTFNTDFFVGQNATGDSLFNLRNGQARRWVALPLGGDQALENTAVYLQDTVNYGKWRFEAGVRWEEYQGSGPLPTFDVNFDDIAPRFGVTYNFNPSWQVLGTWGKYVSRLNDGIVNNVTGVGGAPRIDRLYIGPDVLGVTGDALGTILRDESNWGQILNFVAPDQPTNFLANDLEAPFAEDIQLSIRHALANNTGTVQLSYISRDFRGLLEDFFGDTCSFGLSFDGCPGTNVTQVIDPAGNAVALDTTVWANSSRAKREYEAVSVQWDIRPSVTWSVGGNYTFSENKGNYEGEATNQIGTGSAIGDYERSRPEAAASPFGLTDEDVTHRASLWGSYRFDFERMGNLVLAGIGNYSSGATYNLTATLPLSDDPSYLNDAGGTYTHFFGGRGNRRFDDISSFDLSARYQVPVVSDLDLWVKLTALNVFDQGSLRQFNTAGGAQTVNGELQFNPAGNCGLGDAPSTSCTGFGQIRNENDFQLPRQLFLTVGLRF